MQYEGDQATWKPPSKKLTCASQMATDLKLLIRSFNARLGQYADTMAMLFDSLREDQFVSIFKYMEIVIDFQETFEEHFSGPSFAATFSTIVSLPNLVSPILQGVL